MGSLKLDVPVGVIRRGAARGARVRIRESVRLAIAVQKGSYRSHARNTQARLVTCCALFTKHKLTYLALRKWRGRHMATHRLDRGSGALSVGVAVIVVEQRARGAAGRRVHLLVLRPIIVVAVVRSVNVVLVVIGRSIAVGSLLRRFLASPRTGDCGFAVAAPGAFAETGEAGGFGGVALLQANDGPCFLFWTANSTF